jgi:hypothetical protein
MKTPTKSKPSRTKGSKERSPDQAVLNISLPLQQRRAIERQAKREGHTLSSWVRFKLARLVEDEMSLIS